MIKYRGTFRVCYELDSKGKPAEFTFIPCRIKKGANICRHSSDTLNVYIPSMKIIKSLLSDYPDMLKPFQICDKEGTLLFKEADLEKLLHILKPYVKGKNVSPRAKRNINLLKKCVLNTR